MLSIFSFVWLSFDSTAAHSVSFKSLWPRLWLRFSTGTTHNDVKLSVPESLVSHLLFGSSSSHPRPSLYVTATPFVNNNHHKEEDEEEEEERVRDCREKGREKTVCTFNHLLRSLWTFWGQGACYLSVTSKVPPSPRDDAPDAHHRNLCFYIGPFSIHPAPLIYTAPSYVFESLSFLHILLLLLLQLQIR